MLALVSGVKPFLWLCPQPVIFGLTVGSWCQTWLFECTEKWTVII